MNNVSINTQDTDSRLRLLENSDHLSAELTMIDVLADLLKIEGYSIVRTGGRGEREFGIDFLATNSSNKPNNYKSIGFQYKHTKKPVDVETVQQMVGVQVLRNLDQVVLLSHAGFTKQAWDTIKHHSPTSVELVDIANLRAWVSRIAQQPTIDSSLVVQAITELSKKLARAIAQSPKELIHIEWRDLERMLATIFEELGFDVTLTPSSKDGGKDIILQFLVSGVSQTYIVEIKHWRSGNGVGQAYIKDFVNVIAREKRDGGLYVASYGYAHDAFEALTEIERTNFHAGKEDKIISLCNTFVKSESGLWSQPESLIPVIINDTVSLSPNRHH